MALHREPTTNASADKTDHVLLAQERHDAAKKGRLCNEHKRRSLKCIENNYQDQKAACTVFFEAYKTCRKEETRLRNLKNNGGKEAGFFPWQ